MIFKPFCCGQIITSSHQLFKLRLRHLKKAVSLNQKGLELNFHTKINQKPTTLKTVQKTGYQQMVKLIETDPELTACVYKRQSQLGSLNIGESLMQRLWSLSIKMKIRRKCICRRTQRCLYSCVSSTPFTKTTLTDNNKNSASGYHIVLM